MQAKFKFKPKYSKATLGRTYTGYLAPVDFSGAVFNCAHFQKVAQISNFCDFHYISQGIPFLLDLKKRTSQGLGVFHCNVCIPPCGL